jgi:hypothetical protein
MSVYSNDLYGRALEWIAAYSFPLRNGGGAFESVEEVRDFAVYILEHADELDAEDGDGLDPAGYHILEKREHRPKPNQGAWVKSQWATGCRKCGDAARKEAWSSCVEGSTLGKGSSARRAGRPCSLRKRSRCTYQRVGHKGSRSCWQHADACLRSAGSIDELPNRLPANADSFCDTREWITHTSGPELVDCRDDGGAVSPLRLVPPLRRPHDGCQRIRH